MRHRARQENRGAQRAITALLLAQILVHLGVTIPFLVNMPFWDDFVFLENPSAGHYLQRNNEHLIVFPKVLAAATEVVFGHIDLRVLGVLSSALLVLAALMLAGINQSSASGSKSLMPVFALLILLSPRNWENTLWPLAGLQNHGLVVFSCLSIWFAPSRGWVGSIVCLFALALAFATSAAALPLALVVASARVFARGEGDRQFGVDSVFSVGVLVILVVWGVIGGGVGGGSFSQLVDRPGQCVVRFMVVIGSFLHLPSTQGSATAANLIAFLAGSLLGASVVRGLVTAYRQKWSAADWLALFLLLSAAAVACGRAELGIRQAASSRYSILSLALLVIVVNNAWGRWALHPRRRVALGCILLVWLPLSWIDGVPRAIDHRDSLLISLDEWRTRRVGLLHGDHMDQCRSIMVRATEAGRFRPSGTWW